MHQEEYLKMQMMDYGFLNSGDFDRRTMMFEALYGSLSEEEREQIEINKDKAIKSKDIYDAVSNPIQQFGSGTLDPSFLGLGVTSKRGISWQIPKLDSIMRDVPYFDKAASWKATRALINGIDLNCRDTDVEDITVVQKDLDDHFSPLHDTIKLGDFYGGSGALIITTDTVTEDDYMQPLSVGNLKKGQYLGIKPLTRLYQIMPDLSSGLVRVSDVGEANGIYDAKEVGQPKYYKVNISGNTESESTHIKVHRSRLLLYNSVELSWIEKRIEMYFGPSLLERSYTDFARYESLLAQINKLAQRSNIGVLNMQQLPMANLSGEKFVEKVMQRITQVKFGVQSGGMIVLGDVEKEKFAYENAVFRDLDKILKLYRENLAAALVAPTGVLFNDKDDEDTDKYLVAVKEIQDRIVRSWFKKLIPIIYKNRFNKKLKDYSFSFKSLELPTELEKAEKMKNVVDMLSVLFNDNVIDGASYQRMLAAAPNNISDIPNEITQEYMAHVKAGLEGKPFNKMSLDVILATALNHVQGNEDGDSNLAHKTESAQKGNQQGGDPAKTKKPTVRIPINKKRGD
jgi:hypothetical protein